MFYLHCQSHAIKWCLFFNVFDLNSYPNVLWLSLKLFPGKLWLFLNVQDSKYWWVYFCFGHYYWNHFFLLSPFNITWRESLTFLTFIWDIILLDFNCYILESPFKTKHDLHLDILVLLLVVVVAAVVVVVVVIVAFLLLLQLEYYFTYWGVSTVFPDSQTHL